MILELEIHIYYIVVRHLCIYKYMYIYIFSWDSLDWRAIAVVMIEGMGGA
jgi:hypothetical protein